MRGISVARPEGVLEPMHAAVACDEHCVESQAIAEPGGVLGHQRLRRGNKARALSGPNGEGGGRSPWPRLHLDDEGEAAATGDEVDLPRTGAEAPAEHGETCAFKNGGTGRFGRKAARLRHTPSCLSPRIHRGQHRTRT